MTTHYQTRGTLAAPEAFNAVARFVRRSRAAIIGRPTEANLCAAQAAAIVVSREQGASWDRIAEVCQIPVEAVRRVARDAPPHAWTIAHAVLRGDTPPRRSERDVDAELREASRRAREGLEP